ncbi:pre-mrna-splicing factor syf2 [Stemphylium lycopersici]|uniref:Pre-mRNA-splicing factor SYF2 n=1 Tax=Stemphylium lycopersici TaxID=183478 RepID=A0A364MUX8_STELY|nr:pre-mrna-splicing factor syf2 [Stemphylium lycopersici]RAR04311.1 pre-mrna-splicing factor syf2 [Stemphylium lycopersici]RAR11349.1 pre-mrna-splicing factor syf2 [Stemphylium lycopersici]
MANPPKVEDEAVAPAVPVQTEEESSSTTAPAQTKVDGEEASTTMTANETPAEEAASAQESTSEEKAATTSATPSDPKAALAARMARFKSLQAQKASGRKATEREVRDAEDRSARLAQISKLSAAHDKASYKLLKSEDPDFERKRNWDYTVEESESWDKRLKKKAKNRSGVAFADYRNEANKVYKRQIGQMSKVDMEAYAESKARKLQSQVSSGLLQLVETDAGEIYTVDSQGRINTPVDEAYSHDHRPSKEAVDRLVDDLEKSERSRLKARAARGIRDEQDVGDVYERDSG